MRVRTFFAKELPVLQDEINEWLKGEGLTASDVVACSYAAVAHSNPPNVKYMVIEYSALIFYRVL